MARLADVVLLGSPRPHHGHKHKVFEAFLENWHMDSHNVWNSDIRDQSHLRNRCNLCYGVGCLDLNTWNCWHLYILLLIPCIWPWISG